MDKCFTELIINILHESTAQDQSDDTEPNRGKGHAGAHLLAKNVAKGELEHVRSLRLAPLAQRFYDLHT